MEEGAVEMALGALSNYTISNLLEMERGLQEGLRHNQRRREEIRDVDWETSSQLAVLINQNYSEINEIRKELDAREAVLRAREADTEATTSSNTANMSVDEEAGAADNVMQFEVWDRVRQWLNDEEVSFKELDGPGAVLERGPVIPCPGMNCYVQAMARDWALVRFHAVVGALQQIEANTLALRWILKHNSQIFLGALAVNLDGLVTFGYDIFASNITRTQFAQGLGSMIAQVPRVRDELPGFCAPGTFVLVSG